MGLFDFGDRATIQTLAYRIGVGIEQMEGEIRKSPHIATPMLRGLAYTVMEEKNKMMHISATLSQSSLDSLKVEFKREKILYGLFLQKIIQFSYKVKEMTGIDFINSSVIKDGVEHRIKS